MRVKIINPPANYYDLLGEPFPEFEIAESDLDFVYFFTNTFGRNLAEESSVSALLGSWISAIIMIPFAFLLTRRATKDRGIFNIDVFLLPITRLFKTIKTKGKANAQNNDE